MRTLLCVFLFLLATNCVAQPYNVSIINDSDGYTNVRNGPGTNYGVLTKVLEGEPFLEIGRSGAWTKVITLNGSRGTVGWMHSSRVEVLRPGLGLGLGVINDPDGYTNVRMRPGTGSEVITKVYDGQPFVIQGRGDWVYVSTKNRYQGYMHSSRVRRIFP